MENTFSERESFMELKLIDGAVPVRRRANPVFSPQRGKRSLCRRLVTAAIAAVILATVLEAQAQTTITKEYMVKATCLFNFAQFIEWPAEAFAHATAPIVIGILGNDDFGAFLDELVKNETIKNRPLTIKRSRTVADLKGCHILFISRSEKGRIEEILSSLANASTVTVSEAEGFPRRGGIIGFCVLANRVRFEINAETAKARGLKIAAQLLQLSTACP
jgi:hypothetical protein